MKQLGFVFLLLLMVGCGNMGSGYTEEQIHAIQQGTPVVAVLTAFPVTYAPTRPASVGVGGESAATNAQATLNAVTRMAGEQTRVVEDATRNAGDATRVSASLTRDAVAFQNEQASVNIQLAAEEQLTNLQVILAAQAMTATIRAMNDQAAIDAADVRSAEQQLYWFEQVQRAEAEKALSQARFWQSAQYILLGIAVVLIAAVLYWWFVLRPQQELRVVTVNGNQIPFVKTPTGYAPVLSAPRPQLPDPDDADKEGEAEREEVPPADWGIFANWQDPATLPLGMMPNGRPLAIRLAYVPHLMFAGRTRSGKSGMGLLPYTCGMGGRGAQVVLVNGRGIDFMALENRPGFTIIPQTEGEPLILLVKEMLDALVQEMLHRDGVLKRYQKYTWAQIPSYAGQPGDIVVAIDEFLHIADAANKVESGLSSAMWSSLKRLTNEGGKYGISIALTVTNPTARALGDEGMLVRAQMGRVAFVMGGAAASRTFLDIGQKELPNGTVGFPVGAFAAALDGPLCQAVSFRPSPAQVAAYLSAHQPQPKALPERISQVTEKGLLLAALPQSNTVDMQTLIEYNSRAEKDAQQLLEEMPNEGWGSRRQVALCLTGKDNPIDYKHVDDALQVLVDQGHRWASGLLNSDARYTANHAAA